LVLCRPKPIKNQSRVPEATATRVQTNKQVIFLHEEAVCEMLHTAVRECLLAAPASRTFMMKQTTLIDADAAAVREAGARRDGLDEKGRVDKTKVRVDHTVSTLDAYVHRLPVRPALTARIALLSRHCQRTRCYAQPITHNIQHAVDGPVTLSCGRLQRDCRKGTITAPCDRRRAVRHSRWQPLPYGPAGFLVRPALPRVLLTVYWRSRSGGSTTTSAVS
jgi:hypothetical protein